MPKQYVMIEHKYHLRIKKYFLNNGMIQMYSSLVEKLVMLDFYIILISTVFSYGSNKFYHNINRTRRTCM